MNGSRGRMVEEGGSEMEAGGRGRQKERGSRKQLETIIPVMCKSMHWIVF
jgi:hypothetical protein